MLDQIQKLAQDAGYKTLLVGKNELVVFFNEETEIRFFAHLPQTAILDTGVAGQYRPNSDLPKGFGLALNNKQTLALTGSLDIISGTALDGLLHKMVWLRMTLQTYAQSIQEAEDRFQAEALLTK